MTRNAILVLCFSAIVVGVLAIAVYLRLNTPRAKFLFLLAMTLAGSMICAFGPAMIIASKWVSAIAGATGAVVVFRVCELFPTKDHSESVVFISRLEYQKVFRLHQTYWVLSVLIALLVGMLVGFGVHFVVKSTKT